MRDAPSESREQNKKESVPEGENRASAGSQQKRLEALLIDDEADDAAPVGLLARREVKTVRKKPPFPGRILIFLLLSILVFVGLALILIQTKQQPFVQERSEFVNIEVRRPVPSRPEAETPAISIPSVVESGLQSDTVEIPSESLDPGGANVDEQLFNVEVGPFINSDGLQSGRQILSDLGLQPEQKKGRGPVHMIRLQYGIYPPEEAQVHLAKLKQSVKSAFLLPQGDKKVLYAGSFFEMERAVKLQAELQEKQIILQAVDAEVVMAGTMLVALQADRKTAQQLADHIRKRGLNVRVVETR